MKEGLIHIYCGDGKGKTTAALGLAIRAMGRGLKVLLIQFMKSQETGELKILEKIPQITVMRSKEKFGFSFTMTAQQKDRCRSVHDDLLKRGLENCRLEQIDLLILDEIISAYNYDLIDRAETLRFLRAKPGHLEVVLTGREPAEELLEIADYVSEIKKVKHPFDQGIGARIGIER